MTSRRKSFEPHRSLHAHPIWLVIASLVLGPLAGQGEIPTEPYAFTTYAGWSSIGSEDGKGAQARFFRPNGLAIDSADNLYVADTYNHLVRKIAPDGTVTTLAGGLLQAGAVDGTNAAARFRCPFGVAVDGNNAVFVADAGNAAVRKIADGSVTTLTTDIMQKAYGLTASMNTEPDASTYTPWGDYLAALSVARDGSILGKSTMFARPGPPGVIKLSPGGAVQTINVAAPSNLMFGVFTFATSTPTVASDASGNILGTDSYWTQIYFPDHHPEYGGSGWLLSTLDPAGATHETSITGRRPLVSSDPAGTVCLADIDYGTTYPNGRITVTVTAPGGTTSTFSSTDVLDATWLPISGLVRNRAGDFFYLGAHAVFKMTAGGAVSVMAGVPGDASSRRRDGLGTFARFTKPSAIAADRAGNLYVADGTLRRISPGGVVTTLIGPTDPTAGSSLYPPTVIDPDALAVDDAGNVYFLGPYLTGGGLALTKRAPDGTLTTLLDEASGFPFSHSSQGGLAVDHAGNVYLASFQAVYKISSPGNFAIFAGSADTGAWGYAEGTGAAARFFFITGLAVDAANNVLVSDAGNRRIRRITPEGVVSTIPGGDRFDTVDGSPDTTGRVWPGQAVVDGTGNVFVAGGDNTIRKITPAGQTTLLAGAGPFEGNVDGVGRAVRFLFSAGIALDAAGNIFVTDSYNNTIRKGQLAGPPVITAQPQGQSALAGSSVQLSVAAAGVPLPTYQWQFNGGALGGATGPTLTLSGVQAANAGDYTVVVTNELGSVTSNKATLAVAAAPVPPEPAGGGGGAIGAGLAAALCALGVARRLAASHTRR